MHYNNIDTVLSVREFKITHQNATCDRLELSNLVDYGYDSYVWGYGYFSVMGRVSSKVRVSLGLWLGAKAKL